MIDAILCQPLRQLVHLLHFILFLQQQQEEDLSSSVATEVECLYQFGKAMRVQDE